MTGTSSRSGRAKRCDNRGKLNITLRECDVVAAKMNIIPRNDWKSADCSMEEASLRQTVIKVHEEEAQLLSAFQRETNVLERVRYPALCNKAPKIAA